MGWSTEAPTGRGQARDRWESLQALVSQATDVRRRAAEAPTLAGFVAELDRRAHEQHAPVAEGVTLATLHAAKGLEWDAVFLCGLQEGTMPITYADTPEAIEEERRLLYVGITRARNHLWVSWSLARNPGGQARRKPSRFLAGMRPESAPTAPRRSAGRASARAARRAACKQCQKPLASSRERNRGYCADCPVPYDEELFEVLRRGARSGPTPRASRRTWSSPTPPWRRSPRCGRPIVRGCGRSTASGSQAGEVRRRAAPDHRLSRCRSRESRLRRSE